ncbi:MAG: DUF4380 domain-containing protein [Armatimonadota bacterium]
MGRRLGILGILLVFVAGCGGLESPGTRGGTGRSTRRARAGVAGGAAAAVAASEMQYHGWKALRLSNGIITVVAVPDIGGRVMEYKLKAHPFLWVNPAEFGKLYDPPKTEKERTWHNYGGYKIWPAPQSDWHGPPDPLGSALDAGRWKGEITGRDGQTGVLKLVSPADKEVTGLQITRELTLHSGTTRLTVKETFKNVSDEDRTWSIWDITQVPGSLSKGKKSSPEARIYFPLNPASKFGKGFYEIIEGGSSQWLPEVAPGLVGVKYLHQTGKIGADSQAGWITYVDEKHQYTYAKRFRVDRTGNYPDKGSTVEVYTSGDLSYMEVEVLSPLTTLKPGDSFSFTTDWYAGRCGGPTLDCTNVGVTQKALELGQSQGRTVLTGTFGVFLPGKLEIIFQDDAGQELSTAASIEVDPDKVVELKQPVSVSQEATRIALQVVNELGTPVGILAEAELGPGGSTVARTPPSARSSSGSP